MVRLSAAGVILGVLCAVVVGCGAFSAQAPVRHSCSVTDKKFINVAELNMSALGLWSQDYIQGDAEASEVVAEAQKAAKRVGSTKPTDPSLLTTRALMKAMFVEYGKAIHADAHNRSSGK